MSNNQDLNLRVYGYKILDSTQLEASRIVANTKHNKPFIVVSQMQSAGIGRKQREWISIQGNLHCTLAMRTTLAIGIAALSCCIGAVDGMDLAKYDNKVLQYKWPNDLLWNKKKFGGIIINKDLDHLLIGFGINIVSSPESTVFPATNLKSEGFIISDNVVQLGEKIAICIIRNLNMALDDPNYITNLWLARAYKYNEDININSLHGRFVGISSDGALIVQTNDVQHKIYYGDVS